MHNEKDDSTPSCVFFKASIRRGNAAKDRQNSSSDDENQPSASTFRSSRTVKKGLVTTSTDNSSNRRRQKLPGSDDDQEKLTDIKFKSDRQAQTQGPRDMGATATVEIDTDTQQTSFGNKGLIH
jgi:hypothetical protein